MAPALEEGSTASLLGLPTSCPCGQALPGWEGLLLVKTCWAQVLLSLYMVQA